VSTFFLPNDFIEIRNDVIQLFDKVPVIRLESNNFLGLFGEVDLILSGLDSSNFELCDFLHEQEQAFLQNIRAINFKHSWLAGRLLAKSTWLQLNKNNHKNSHTITQLNQLNIISRNQSNLSITPKMFFNGEVVDNSFSISHIDSHATVFFAKNNNAQVGCDLVNPDSITDNLQKLFYDQNEINFLHNANKEISLQFHKERIWGVKETAFKILGNNRTFKPEKWLTEYIGNGWYQCIDADSQNQNKINIRTTIIKNKILTIGNN
jgi:phosphopantetheinyl transferase